MKVRRIDANGDACFGHGESDWLHDADAVAQCVYSACKLTLGSWFLDTSLGVAWAQQPTGQPSILGRQFDQTFAESELKRVVLETSGVSAIQAFTLDYDSTARTLAASIDILTVYGAPRTIVARLDT
jgi:hypothetical protein